MLFFYIGESVAWFIGLDESKFQYIIDGMSEEELMIAKAIDIKRRRERGENIPIEATATATATTTNDIQVIEKNNEENQLTNNEEASVNTLEQVINKI